MKLRTWHWVTGALVIFAGLPLGVSSLHARQDAAALGEQLRLARAEGIPTTPAEFAATVPTSTPAENAATYYKELKFPQHDLADPSQLSLDVTFRPNSKTLQTAHAYLDRHRDVLAIVDKAVTFPRCWFDRDWTLPSAVAMPEYAEMKWAAKCVVLRAALAAQRGTPSVALTEIRKVFTISKHAGDERTKIANLEAGAIYSLGLSQLASWCYAHPDVQAYRDAFDLARKAFPMPNLQEDDRESLVDDLSLVELTTTQAGRRKLGLRPGDEAPFLAARILSAFQSQPKSKIELVKADREYFEALGHPLRERVKSTDAATARRERALMAFPIAAKLGWEFSEGQNMPLDRLTSWQARRQQYEALARAFVGVRIPKSIKTSDLLSPIDGMPLSYRFSGKQIVIEVSGYGYDGTPTLLKVPSDAALKP